MSGEQDSIYIEDETLRAGFTVIPNTIFARRDISAGAKLAYMLLLSYAWQKGSCFPGQQRMCDDMGVSVRSLRNYLRELESAGLVVTKRRGLTQTNIYYLPQKPVASSDRQDSADQERQPRSGQDRQGVPTKKTQIKNGDIDKYDTPENADRNAHAAWLLSQQNNDA